MDDVLAAGQTVTAFIKSFGGDKVPNYPIKSLNTLKSLQASIAQEIPLPPRTVTDAQMLLTMTQQARAAGVARGTDPASRTTVMMYDEIAAALNNYIASNGGIFQVVPGSTQTNLPSSGLPPYLSPAKDNTLLYVGGAAVLVYFLTRKKRR